ncbi:hypothetical protein FQA39_LY13645 [Lamprigera yunnana]|nr:hypothetical protein FQA39_LY13645 [Lamprigera yunnana]
MSCNKVITYSVTFIILSSISSSIKSQWMVDDMGCRTPTLGVGNCIPIKECKIIIDLLLHTSSIPAWMSEELSLYQCGFSGQSTKVCCPYRKSDLDYFYVKLREPDVGNRNFLRHPNLDLLPKDCGPFQYGDRIVNGELSGLFEFPWMALLSYKTKNGIDFKCSGTVINNRYILTAAHCISNIGDQKLIGVRVGEHNITSQFDCTTLYPNIVECANPVQDVAVDSIIVHPNYDTSSHQNDIGLIRLAWALNTSTNNVKPICLPTTKELTNLNFTGNRLTVSGWGKTETDWVFDDEGCVLPNQRTGVCINIYQCQSIMDYIRSIKVLTQDTSDKLFKYYCGVDDGAIKVCCSDEPIIFSRSNSVDTTDRVDLTDKANLLPSDCGASKTIDYIVGGAKTLLFEYPWMALLGYKEGEGVKFKCSGTIINDRYILTAAHCVQESEKPIIVRLGEHNLETEEDCQPTYLPNGQISVCAPPVQDIEIAEIIPHPQFSLTERNNDIALLRLVSPINTSVESAKPICLPLTSASYNRTFVNQNFIVTGWGVTETLKTSVDLLKVELPILNIADCQNTYRLLKVDISEDKQFCVGGQMKKDSCNGDSGGPLQNIVAFENDIRFVQYGIVSYGPKFCGKGLPAIYTRVDHYINWILSTIRF